MQRVISCINVYITMARITVAVSDSSLSQIDNDAKQLGVSRSQWVADALDAYLNQKRITGDADVESLMQEVNQLKDKAMQLQHQLDAKNADLEEAHKTTENTMHLRDELDAKDRELKEHQQQADQRWRETSQLRSEVSQLKRELEGARGKITQLQTEFDRGRTEAEDARRNADTLRHEADKLRGALQVKQDEVDWLRGHVGQLTQQLALPPSEEEIRAKRWWQFWRRS